MPRVVAVSDTHGKHRKKVVPDGDIFVHCGDFSTRLHDLREADAVLEDFNDWLGSLPFQARIVIAGNHEIFGSAPGVDADYIQKRLSNCIYLQDSGTTALGVRFYGTPWTTSHGMGFSASSRDIDEKWARIPRGGRVDVLVTHSPPFGILDCAYQPKRPTEGTCAVCGREHYNFRHWGSDSLLRRVQEDVRPQVHLFGHVHDDPGTVERDGITFANAAVDLRGKPIVVDVEPRPVQDDEDDGDDMGGAGAQPRRRRRWWQFGKGS
jgi:Icc-related predicted phosphoesterase